MQQNPPHNPSHASPSHSLTVKLWRKPAVVSRRLPEKTVLLNGVTGQCYELNRLGSEVWTLLDGSRTLQEICELLLPLLGTPERRLSSDIQTFAEELQAAGLADRSP